MKKLYELGPFEFKALNDGVQLESRGITESEKGHFYLGEWAGELRHGKDTLIILESGHLFEGNYVDGKKSYGRRITLQ